MLLGDHVDFEKGKGGNHGVPGGSGAWRTRDEAAKAITEWIEVFYNRHRRHSTLGMISPADFEDSHRRNAAQAA